MNKEKPKYYRSRIYLGKIDGKPKYKNIYAHSLPELKAKESEFRNNLNIGMNLKSLNSTFQMWATHLLTGKRHEMTTGEYNTFKNRLMYFYAYVGMDPLNKITQADIQTAIYDLYERNPYTGKPSAKNTIARYLHACSAVFDYAMQNKAAFYNPCEFVKIPKQAVREERRALSPEERRWVIETEHRAKLPAMIAMLSGLRKGEITCLTWDDIDLNRRTITVNKSYSFKRHEIKPPKTEAGERTVHIPKMLADYLRGIERKSKYVVAMRNGKMMSESAWTKLWNSYILDLNVKYGDDPHKSKFDPRGNLVTIQPFTLHCLRHTFCTIMYEAGIDALTACKQMGHSDIKTTLGIYTHLDKIYKEKNISKMDDYLTEFAL